jgi:hypothetical protein
MALSNSSVGSSWMNVEGIEKVELSVVAVLAELLALGLGSVGKLQKGVVGQVVRDEFERHWNSILLQLLL